MQKHGVILDMSCDKLTFWPGHCQHSRVKKLLVLTVKAEPHAKKQHTKLSLVLAKQAKDSKAALKMKISKVLEASLKIFLLPQVKRTVKPLKLAMIGATLF